MRRKIKILRLSVLMAFLTLVSSCRNELTLQEEPTLPYQQAATVKRLSYKELIRVPGLLQEISRIKISGDKASRTYTDEKYGYTAETDNAFYMESREGVKTYTFKITRTKPSPEYEGMLENLVLKDLGERKFMAYLTQYDDVLLQSKEVSKEEVEQHFRMMNIGEKTSSEIFGKYATCIGTVTSNIYVQGTKCQEGLHDYGDTSCVYYNKAGAAQPGYYTTQYSFFEYSCSSGGGAPPPTNDNGTPTLPNTGNGGGGTITLPADQCTQLKDLYKTSKNNIKPLINELKGKINNEEENGKSLIKYENKTYTSQDAPPGDNLKIIVQYGKERYGSIHTHPYPGAVPMFSWTDVYSLQLFYQEGYNYNNEEVVIIIVCKDDNGVDQVYALKIDDPVVFFDAIVQDVQNNPKINSNDPREEILKKMDEKLTDLYTENYPERESTFLKRFANFGISLYKADTNLTTWNKLILENGIVKSIPCN